MADKKIYLSTVIGQVPRLLSQLDRNPFSLTYGCFDWNYWHDKITGFPNGHMQESMLVLSLLHTIDDKDNPYYNNHKIRYWAIAALRYWAKVQHRDGTVDEFYVNERQLGATAITLYAASKTFILLEKYLKDLEKRQIRHAIRRSSTILSRYDETHVLSNHQSQVLLALHYAGKILNKDYSVQIQKRLKRVLDNQSKDGWFREYTGADLGYLSTTISFLAEYYYVSKDRRLNTPLKRAMKFASYFIYPDGFFGGIIGSRNTAHLWTSGFEIMNSKHQDEFGFASCFCDVVLESMESGRLLTPEKEDRYFSEQMYDYLNAYLNYTRNPKSKNKNTDDAVLYKSRDFRIFFDDSKIYVSKLNGIYLIINAKKGGIIKAYDIAKKKAVFSDSGLIGRLSNGKTIISGYIDEENNIEISKDRMIINGRFKYSSGQKQSVVKISMLNLLMMAVGRCVSISNFIKDKLISMLISGKKHAGVDFRREVDFNSGLVTDLITIKDSGLRFKSLAILDNLKDIFVAYSKYFDLSELETSNFDISKDKVSELNKTRKLVVNRKLGG